MVRVVGNACPYGRARHGTDCETPFKSYICAGSASPLLTLHTLLDHLVVSPSLDGLDDELIIFDGPQLPSRTIGLFLI